MLMKRDVSGWLQKDHTIEMSTVASKSTSWYAKPVRWMDYLDKGKVTSSLTQLYSNKLKQWDKSIVGWMKAVINLWIQLVNNGSHKCLNYCWGDHVFHSFNTTVTFTMKKVLIDGSNNTFGVIYTFTSRVHQKHPIMWLFHWQEYLKKIIN